MAQGAALEQRDGIDVYGNYINGQWHAAASGETTENRNPTNPDEVIGHFASSGARRCARRGGRRTMRSLAGPTPRAITRANILYKASEILASRIPRGRA